SGETVPALTLRVIRRRGTANRYRLRLAGMASSAGIICGSVSVVERGAALKGGCSHDWLPHLSTSDQLSANEKIMSHLIDAVRRPTKMRKDWPVNKHPNTPIAAEGLTFS